MRIRSATNFNAPAFSRDHDGRGKRCSSTASTMISKFGVTLEAIIRLVFHLSPITAMYQLKSEIQGKCWSRLISTPEYLIWSCEAEVI